MSNQLAKEENYSTEVSSFLDALFGSQKGYVYTPTKDTETGYWQTYFFRWPQDKTAIITHTLSATRDKDVYVAPSLFKAPSDKRQAWKGSNYIWIEFDGNAPEKGTLPKGIPEPSIRIQSSVKGHEHWYWKLNSYETDYHALEGLTKGLSYTLEADLSGWECNQVLRAPGTLHQESRKRVRLLASKDTSYTYSDFKDLVVPPQPILAETTFDDLPDVQLVVAKYKWEDEAFNLFHKATQPIGSRSSAMTRLGFHCVEMGMSNAECYVVLLNADERWGKYKNRSPADRAKRLIGIISHCRGKKELEAELNLSQRESLISVGDLRKTKIKAKWLFQDLITEKGLGIISAAPGIGKSTLSIRLGISVVLKQDFLLWKCAMDSGKRVAFISLEMGRGECNKFIEDMWPSLTQEEQDLVDENFFFYPLGSSMALYNKHEQQMILDFVDTYKIDFLIIDSLKAATGLDEKRLDSFFDFMNKHVRNDRSCTVWLVHHNRKPPNEGSRKPRDLGDLYGDTFIGTHPTAVIALWKESKNVLQVIPLKVRLAEETDIFKIRRGDNLTFEVEERKVTEETGEKETGNGKSNPFE